MIRPWYEKAQVPSRIFPIDIEFGRVILTLEITPIRSEVRKGGEQSVIQVATTRYVLMTPLCSYMKVISTKPFGFIKRTLLNWIYTDILDFTVHIHG